MKIERDHGAPDEEKPVGSLAGAPRAEAGTTVLVVQDELVVRD